MELTSPEWLTRHAGQLRPHYDGASWVVFFSDEPQYLLVPSPVGGRFGCRVSQTINGRRLDGTGVYGSVGEALAGGLEDLRKVLGW